MGFSIDVLLARSVQLLVSLKGEGKIDWHFYAQSFGVFKWYRLSETLKKRTTYKNWARSFLEIIAENDEKLALDFIKYVIKNELDFDDEKHINHDKELLLELNIIKKGEKIEMDKIIDFGIITVLDCERDAINEILNLEKTTDNEGFICFKGAVKHLESDKDFEIIHYCGNQGNVEVGPFVSKLLKWNPEHIVLIGIAGGINSNNVKIGDVLISEKVIYYSKKKITEDKVEPRIKEYTPDTLLSSHFRTFPSSKKEKKWFEKVKPKYKSLTFEELGKPEVHFGPIFTGDLLVKKKIIVEDLLQINSKAIGFEQESAGVFTQTSYAIERPRTITLRGVSDLADKPNSKTWDKYHEYASNVVATYFCEFLKYGKIKPKKKE